MVQPAIDALRGPLSGHWWTLRPALGARLRPRPVRGGRAWRIVEDGVTLTGVLHPARTKSDTALVVVHGLGGSADSYYCHEAARAGLARGFDVLRFNMRGADGRGQDVYHAGLSADVHAAIEALPHRNVLLLGVSMGGHLSLWVSTQPHDDRLRAVAALCPPIDLRQGCLDIDRPHRRLYRNEVLSSLVAAALPVAKSGRLDVSPETLLGLRSLRAWDHEVVVPRYGFGDVDTYHRQMSVAPRLAHVGLPTLLVASRHDPMVLGRTVRRALARTAPSDALEVRWVERAGHVGFPPGTHLGVEGAPAGIYPQLVGWLARFR